MRQIAWPCLRYTKRPGSNLIFEGNLNMGLLSGGLAQHLAAKYISLKGGTIRFHANAFLGGENWNLSFFIGFKRTGLQNVE